MWIKPSTMLVIVLACILEVTRAGGGSDLYRMQFLPSSQFSNFQDEHFTNTLVREKYSKVTSFNEQASCRYGECSFGWKKEEDVSCYRATDCNKHFVDGKEYGSIDGSCNNEIHHNLGMAGTPMRRLLPPQYGPHISPRMGKYGKELESAKSISETIAPLLDPSKTKMTNFAAKFWSFIYFDLISTPKVETDNCCHSSFDLKWHNSSFSRSHECFPIISTNKYGESCENFVRNHRYQKLSCDSQKTEQISMSSMWLDLSNVYGSSQHAAAAVRDPHDARFLKTSKSKYETLLPTCKDSEVTACFFSGDKRMNDDLLLAIQNLLFVREHNRIASQLSKFNSHWSKEKIFQETRRILIAMYQNIMYSEALPTLLGSKYSKEKNLLPMKHGYKFQHYEDNIDPRVSTEFATAAFRLNFDITKLPLVNELNKTTDSLDADMYQGNPSIVAKKGFIDDVIRGSLQCVDEQKNEVSNIVKRGSIAIQRGRDRGIPGYNRYRELAFKDGVRDFNAFAFTGILSPVATKMMKHLYSNVDDVDLWVGGALEDPVQGSLIGKTFRAIITDQFKRLKEADRFWFENKEAKFSPEQLAELRKSSIAGLLCNNFNLDQIQHNAFLKVGSYNRMEFCSQLAQPDLTVFADYGVLRSDAKDETEAPKWSYSGLTGPEFWSKTYPDCGGQSQSPIDITFKKLIQGFSAPLQFYNYDKLFEATLKKKYLNFDLTFAGSNLPFLTGGYLPKGVMYRFAGLHFHWGTDNSEGSEHTLNGKSLPAEAHFVHYNTKYDDLTEAAGEPDGLLVLGFFLQVNKRSSPGLTQIVRGLEIMNRKEALTKYGSSSMVADKSDDTLDIGRISATRVLGFNPLPTKYVFYKGSLTTPGCSENVLWHVFPQPIPVTEHDLNIFRRVRDEDGNIISGNFRPVQPVNGRQVIMNGKVISQPTEISEDSKSSWSYSGLTGPEYWSKTYPECGGSAQSPIDISLKYPGKRMNLPLTGKNYNRPYQAVLEKGDYNVDMKFEDGDVDAIVTGGFIPNKNKYEFGGLHFHWGSNNSAGSEHRLNGNDFPAEAHFVHFNRKYGTLQEAADKKDGLLVMGFFLKVSAQSTDGLSQISAGLKSLVYNTKKSDTVHIGKVSIADIIGGLPDFTNYVFYKGSLTTPPCTENVLWHVFLNPVPISQHDLNIFRMLTNDEGKSFSDNFRPVQPINGRQIFEGKVVPGIEPRQGLEAGLEEAPPKWSYSGLTGPDYWYRSYPMCGGDSQSPIDIPSFGPPFSTAPSLKFMFYNKLYPAFLEKGDHNVDLKFEGENFKPSLLGGYFKDQYEFAGLHFHWGSNNYKGSEHRVRGYEYPGEAHFVHFNKKYGTLVDAVEQPDGLLVLGAFLKLSRDSTFGMKRLVHGLKIVQNSGRNVYIGEISIESILGALPDPTKYVFYKGSLTTPPCSESVLWHVLPHTIPVTQDQLDVFRQLTDEEGKSFSDNNRPVQPLNGRQVIANGQKLIDQPLNIGLEKKAADLTVVNRRQPVTVQEKSAPSWSYYGSTGPEFWSRNYPECGGRSQSPINIITYQTFKKASTPLSTKNYDKFYPAILEKGDHNVDMKFQGGMAKPQISGGYIPAGEVYEFAGLHFHWGSNNKVGSEHRLNGFEYPAEAHFVHFNTKYGNVSGAAGQQDGLLVLGFFLQVGAKSSIGLSQLVSGLQSLQKTGKEELYIGHLAIDSIIGYPSLREYYFYQGSLTTPPCTENVLWHVFPNTVPISQQLLDVFRTLTDEDGKSFSNNNRPAQDLNGRKVLKKRI